MSRAATTNDMTAGENPTYGASINYWLKAAPRSPASIAILDASGRTVRTLQDSARAGVNRVHWKIQEQMPLLAAIYDDVNVVAEMINRIEATRAQLQSLGSSIANDRALTDVGAAAGELEQKFIAVEDVLVQLRLTGGGQDGVRWPAGIGSKLTRLAGTIASSDWAPTAQQREAHTELRRDVQKHRAQLDALMQRDLVEFNQLLRRRNVRQLITVTDGG